MKYLLILIAATALMGQSVVNGSRTVKGVVDNSGATSTKPTKAGTSLPGTCGLGELFFKTDATAGQNLYFCTATNTWTQQLNSGGGGGGGKQIFVAPIAATIGSSAAIWFNIAGGTTTPTSPGTSRRTVLSTSGTFVASSARLHVGSAFPAGGTSVCKLQIDNVDTSITLTIAASTASGSVISATGSNESYTAEHYVSWNCTNNVAATSGTISSISIDFTY
jgi:hypothetical protein